MIEHRIIINRIRLIERDDRGIKKRGEKRRISCREFSPFADRSRCFSKFIERIGGGQGAKVNIEIKLREKDIHIYISERTVDIYTERYRDGATASRGGGSRTVGSVEFYVACLLQEFSRQASLR